MFGNQPPLSFTNDRVNDLILRGTGAAAEGRRDEAIRLLQLALAAGPGPAERIKIWRALAGVAADPSEKRRYLEQILAVDPADGLARRDLAILDGRLTQADVAGRDRPDGAPAPPAIPARIVCRTCGSPSLVFSAADGALVCEHCGAVEKVPLDAGPAPGDFAAAMWSAAGHRTATDTPTIVCDGCGAGFLAPPGQLSMTCPYCDTTYALDRVATRRLIAPDRTAPFTTKKEDAAAALDSFARERGVTMPSGELRALFEPAWVLNFVGSVEWRGYRHAENGERNPEPVSGAYAIVDRVVAVAATTRASAAFDRLTETIGEGGLLPYDHRLLAGIPAALYDVTLDQAMPEARRRAIQRLRGEVLESTGPIANLSMDFSRMGVDVFTLALLPVWSGELVVRGSRVPVVVDGRTGVVWADVPASARQRTIAALRSLLHLTDDSGL